MDYAAITDRLAGLGAEVWAVHFRGRELQRAGRDIIELTIGEPDVPPDPAMIAACATALQSGRVRYSDGQGEPALRAAIAARYADRAGRPVSPDQVLCVPGTQTALFAASAALVQDGDEVLLPDPYYATYQGVLRATGATVVPVKMDPAGGFRLSPGALEAAITPRTRMLLLNSPHNPTGTVMSAAEIAAIGEVCARHDLWILSDEVYEDLILEPGLAFASPFDNAALADRTVVVSSISKSHAVPGFRSGWMVGPREFAARTQPLIEMMLFGNQPFIADATTYALTHPSPTAARMRTDYARRARAAVEALSVPGLRPLMPQAGMFLMLDVSAIAPDSDAFARSLLEAEGVSVMPGTAFGAGAQGWLRMSLTVPDARLTEACRRITAHAGRLTGQQDAAHADFSDA